jgi:hypothetical protein
MTLAEDDAITGLPFGILRSVTEHRAIEDRENVSDR